MEGAAVLDDLEKTDDDINASAASVTNDAKKKNTSGNGKDSQAPEFSFDGCDNMSKYKLNLYDIYRRKRNALLLEMARNL